MKMYADEKFTLAMPNPAALNAQTDRLRAQIGERDSETERGGVVGRT